MDIGNVATVISGLGVGALAALMLKGRLGLLLAWAQLGLAGGGREMKMVLIVRSDLQINKNKAAVHCSEAAINCYKRARVDTRKLLQRWEADGQAKVVLKTEGESELLKLAENAQAAGLVAVVIHDSTNTPTVLGIGPGPKKVIDNIAGHLKLF